MVGQRVEAFGAIGEPQGAHELPGAEGLAQGGLLAAQFVQKELGVGDALPQADFLLFCLLQFQGQLLYFFFLFVDLWFDFEVGLLACAKLLHGQIVLFFFPEEPVYLSLQKDRGALLLGEEFLQRTQVVFGVLDEALHLVQMDFGLVEGFVEDAHQEFGYGFAGLLAIKLFVVEERRGGRLLIDVEQAQ